MYRTLIFDYISQIYIYDFIYISAQIGSRLHPINKLHPKSFMSDFWGVTQHHKGILLYQ